jgi:hypothetical protein
MADPTTIRTKRITELQVANPILGDELLPCLQEGITRKIDMFTFNNYIRTRDYATWVLTNSATEIDATSFVNSSSSNNISSYSWITSNSAREVGVTNTVLTSAANWSAAYNFTLGVVSGGLGTSLLGSDAVNTTNINNAAVTPDKLSSGSPTWTANTVNLNSKDIYLNPAINTDTSLYLNNTTFNKNSNILHRGTGKLNISTDGLNSHMEIKTLKDADIIFKTNDIERMSIDGTTGNVVFNYGITIPTGYKISVPSIDVLDIDISNIPQPNFKIKSGGRLDFLKSTLATSYYLRLLDNDNAFTIYNNNNNTYSLYIDSTSQNKVGLGTNTPSEKLTVIGNTKTDNLFLGTGTQTYPTTPTGSAAITFNSSGNSLGRFVMNDGSENINLYLNSYNDGTNKYAADSATNGACKFQMSSGAFHLQNAIPGAVGSAVTWNTGLYLDNLGNAGIGTATLATSRRLTVQGEVQINAGSLYFDNSTWVQFKDSAGAYKSVIGLFSNNITYIQGNGINFRNLAAANLGYFDTAGNLTTTGDVAAYSDERLKKNVKTIDHALQKVNSLRGVEFDRIDIDKKSIGFIAQEIEKVLPEVVNSDGEYKTVSYGNIVGLLVEAIKELTTEIEELKNKLK